MGREELMKMREVEGRREDVWGRGREGEQRKEMRRRVAQLREVLQRPFSPKRRGDVFRSEWIRLGGRFELPRNKR